MPKFGKLAIVCHSDTGLVRDHNEDCVAGDVALGAVVLADGMGGYQAGEVASEIAVQRIMQELHERRDTLKLSEIDSQSESGDLSHRPATARLSRHGHHRGGGFVL